MKNLILLLPFVTLSACATVSSYETVNGQNVAVGQASNGDTLKRFPYVNGTSLTVRYNAANATVTHVLESPATDAQKRSFVEEASGCRTTTLLNQFNQTAQGGITITTYLLSC
jgi:UDP-3-O-acyl-N-acetylglucosamine deacetylase